MAVLKIAISIGFIAWTFSRVPHYLQQTLCPNTNSTNTLTPLPPPPTPGSRLHFRPPNPRGRPELPVREAAVPTRPPHRPTAPATPRPHLHRRCVSAQAQVSPTPPVSTAVLPSCSFSVGTPLGALLLCQVQYQLILDFCFARAGPRPGPDAQGQKREAGPGAGGNAGRARSGRLINAADGQQGKRSESRTLALSSEARSTLKPYLQVRLKVAGAAGSPSTLKRTRLLSGATGPHTAVPFDPCREGPTHSLRAGLRWASLSLLDGDATARPEAPAAGRSFLSPR